MPEYQVQILLSTYNGDAFLREQLNSILNQSFTDWQVLIRDDGSTDDTLNIIQEYQGKQGARIKLINGGEGGDASSSFMSLIKFSNAPYLMFCDQDDVWLPQKVTDSLALLKQLEKEHEVVLVYTDMQVVSSNLSPLHESFLSHQKLNPSWRNDTYAVFAQSMAAGCTMLFNRALVERLHPISAPLFQHDHWVLMHAAYYGKIGFLDTKSMQYRQHTQNAVGSHDINLGYFTAKAREFKQIWMRWKYLRKYFRPKLSLYKLMMAKIRLNSSRLMTF